MGTFFWSHPALCLLALGVAMIAATLWISHLRTRALIRRQRTNRTIDLTPPVTCYRDGRCGYCDRLEAAEKARLAEEVEREKHNTNH